MGAPSRWRSGWVRKSNVSRLGSVGGSSSRFGEEVDYTSTNITGNHHPVGRLFPENPMKFLPHCVYLPVGPLNGGLMRLTSRNLTNNGDMMGI